MFSVYSKEMPKSPVTINIDEKDEVPQDESASEKSLSEKSVNGKSEASEPSTSGTNTPRHKIVLDRNVSIKLGRFNQVHFNSSSKTTQAGTHANNFKPVSVV